MARVHKKCACGFGKACADLKTRLGGHLLRFPQDEDEQREWCDYLGIDGIVNEEDRCALTHFDFEASVLSASCSAS